MNNNHQGVFLDDFVSVLPARGEMVTGHYNPNVIIDDPEGSNRPASIRCRQYPPIPISGEPQKLYTGVFQLDIRRGTEYGASIGGTSPIIGLYDTFDVNDRLAQALRSSRCPRHSLVTVRHSLSSPCMASLRSNSTTNNSVAAGNRQIAIQIRRLRRNCRHEHTRRYQQRPGQ